ncbi:MAG: hypothetical protein U1A24_10320 [Cypionkella sp.]|uniref:hypothetical protein n=1 Tax=Cypionkella sp. TaxID=2811411 RepID=UPI002AB91705|nr:hypothetical protein [Cypionkella sp.]MDZ4310933.1 hypothetical protein [Cypionkella sp.]
MELSQINDAESLREWLESLPQTTDRERRAANRVAREIAHRVAMRVLPSVWLLALFPNSSPFTVDALPILRRNLTAGVATVRPSAETTFAAMMAGLDERYSGALDLESFGTEARKAGMAAEHAAIDAAKAGHNSDFKITAKFAASTAESGEVGITGGGISANRERISDENVLRAYWEMIRSDCGAFVRGENLDSRPLWEPGNPLATSHADPLHGILPPTEGDRFWLNWYENAVFGRLQDWGLLTKIALIGREDWHKGVEHINAMISDIRLTHIVQTRPLGEDSIDIGTDGFWHRTGRSSIDRDILRDAVEAVSDEIERTREYFFGPKSNMYSALAADLELLEERIARYPDRPLRLHDTFLRTAAHISRDIESGELPDDAITGDLSSVLQTSALDLRNACPSVNEVVTARIGARFAEADEAARQDLIYISDAAASLSDEDLASEFHEDAQIATDVTLSEAAKVPALYRLTTRLSVMIARGGRDIVDALVLVDGVSGGIAVVGGLIYWLLRLII